MAPDTERWWIGEVRGESDYDEVLVGGGIWLVGYDSERCVFWGEEGRGRVY